MKKKRLIILCIAFLSCFLIVLYLLYRFNFISHKKYTNKFFGIKTYVSDMDKDNDGIDDQTDILVGARRYVATKPKYKSKYYSNGYPDDE